MNFFSHKRGGHSHIQVQGCQGLPYCSRAAGERDCEDPKERASSEQDRKVQLLQVGMDVNVEWERKCWDQTWTKQGREGARGGRERIDLMCVCK